MVSGAIHVHTTYSDGSGTVPEVAAAAQEAGLAFVILSDHDTLKALEEGWAPDSEGPYDWAEET